MSYPSYEVDEIQIKKNCNKNNDKSKTHKLTKKKLILSHYLYKVKEK